MNRSLPLLALAAALTPAAFADLILAPTQVSGAGLGNLTTILTITSQGNDTFESGCVTADGINVNCPPGVGASPAGQVQTGASQTALRTLPTGVAATDFRWIFNAAEPGSSNDILLQSLTIQFYNAAGGLLHVATYQGTPILLDTLQGIGSAGYQLTLDPNQAGIVQGFLDAGTVQVGASFAAGCSTGRNCAGAAGGGIDVVQFGTVPGGGGGTVVPEPMSFVLMGGGLAALAVMRRFR